jgi:hypothetical protein
MLKTKNPYGANMTVKSAVEFVESGVKANQGKATARYPNKPRTNEPGGGGTTGGSHMKAAATPGGPTGS